MPNSRARIFVGLFVVVASGLAFLDTAPACAALGEPVQSLEADQEYFHGERRTVAGTGYSVQEITTADGSLIREYVSPAGLVFGVSWKGPGTPDLPQLLGSYLPELQRAPRSRASRHAPRVIRTEHLVVETGGHPRAFHGRAYTPDLVPDSLSEAVIQ